MASLKSNTYELREQLYNKQNKSRFSSTSWNNPVNVIGTTVTGVFSDLSQGFIEKTGGLTNGDVNKAWRLKILADKLGGPASGRVTGLPRDGANTGKSSIPNKLPNQKVCQAGGYPNPKLNETSKEVWKADLNEGLIRPIGEVEGEHFERVPLDQPNHKTFKVGRTFQERQSLYKKAHDHKRNEIIIFNMNGIDETYQYLILQNRPPELEFHGETSWAAIKSFGRNVPMYHFTGAEDKIQLQISWFCNDPERPWEVIQKCRLLEAWSKSNGYAAGPPILQLDWGGSGLFDNAYFILTSATYILKQFRDGYMNRRNSNVEWNDGKLYPMAATQELIFSRVSSTNPMYSSIYDPTKLEGVKGIGTSKRDQVASQKDNQSSLWQA